jgi:RNA recognition motif-containing protein
MAPEAGEGCRLFVYGVAEGTPNLELQAEFERFGLVTDTYNTGKGYAFVTFDNSEDARTATEELNGATVCGQQIKVGGNLFVCLHQSLTK